MAGKLQPYENTNTVPFKKKIRVFGRAKNFLARGVQNFAKIDQKIIIDHITFLMFVKRLGLSFPTILRVKIHIWHDFEVIWGILEKNIAISSFLGYS